MLTEKTLLDLIPKKRGNVAAIARACQVRRQSVSQFIARRPDLAAALEEARETMLDDAEAALYEAALAGNITALIFFLKTQGRGRGWTENDDIERRLQALEHGDRHASLRSRTA